MTACPAVHNRFEIVFKEEMHMFNIIPYRTQRPAQARDFFDAFDDGFFRPFFEGGLGSMLRAQNSMKVDIREEDDRYLLEADIPGVKKEALRVEANDGLLTIGASYDTGEEQEQESGGYMVRERRTGSFHRSFRIDGIREDGITARFRDGVLTLELPKQPEQPERQAHTIEIQ